MPRQGSGLGQKLQLIAGLIAKGFGTRIFYVSLDGFDTHANQGPAHSNLLADLANSVSGFFQTLKTTGHDRRVRLMTFSEFGRRVQENGSRGTDHGAASCLFVAGPSVKGGVVGKHPSLADLDADDLKFHTDFRRRLRDPARRLAGLRQQGRARREVGPRQGTRAQGLRKVAWRSRILISRRRSTDCRRDPGPTGEKGKERVRTSRPHEERKAGPGTACRRTNRATPYRTSIGNKVLYKVFGLVNDDWVRKTHTCSGWRPRIVAR